MLSSKTLNIPFNAGVIYDHHLKIMKTLDLQISDDTVIIPTHWLGDSEKVYEFCELNRTKTNCLLLSTIDWENTICRKPANDRLKDIIPNPIYIGNTYGDNYFSFWLDFVFTHFPTPQKTIAISKPFMSLNRMPKGHREHFALELYNNNLLNKGIVSFGKSTNLPFETPLIIKDDIVNAIGDESWGGDNPSITNDITSFGNDNIWSSFFVNVVTESVIHTDVFLSEKTFKPILGFKPFMILGDNKVYQVLHNWGIDTFDDIFGTGYNAPFHDERINWIIHNLKWVVKDKHLDKLYKDIHPRLVHNRYALQLAYINNHIRIEDIAKKY